MHRLKLLLPLLAAGCASQLGAPMSDAVLSDEPPDPFAGPLPADLALRQNTLVRRAIFEGNFVGAGIYEGAINAELNTLGIAALVTIAPMTPLEAPKVDAEPETEFPDYQPEADPTPEANDCVYARPALPEADVSCRFVASQALDTAYVRSVQEMRDNPVPEEYVADAPDPNEVETWYGRAVDFSLDHNLLFAIDALRTANVCDLERQPTEEAFEAGVRLGRDLMRETTLERETGTPRTRCDTDSAIVEPARTLARDRAPGVTQENPLCPGFAGSPEATARLAGARAEYEDGVLRGIEEQGLLESGRLAREWVCTPPAERTGDDEDRGGGGRNEGGAANDPLVLDLDGNGVNIEPVRFGTRMDLGFDGTVVTEWTQPGDAFVVLDRNGDGNIDQTELFGDVTLAEGGLLARNGFEALALYDDARQGGNADHVINAEDEIYPALGAWDDRDGDAQVDDGELVSLAEAGVVEIDIDREEFVRVDGTTGAAVDLEFNYVKVE